MQTINFSLLQAHTVKIYSLEQKKYELQNVSARSLLTGQRFDLFAKLFYIRNRQKNKSLALEVYKQHIRAFNPDLREPGREDKNNYDDFISTFDALIDDLTINGFDSSKSLIPVDEDGVILDGAHRLCALAYADKQVRIVKFKDVKSKAKFDYDYFLKRGLSWKTADIIAFEMVRWLPNMLIACLWPRMGNLNVKNKTLEFINRQYPLCYRKSVNTNLESFVYFVAKIYETQPWVGNASNGYAGARNKALNCFASNKQIVFALFEFDKLEDVIALKAEIRQCFQCEKHSIHITDNVDESRDIAKLIFDSNTLNKWNKISSGVMSRLRETIREKIFYFKNITLIKWKVVMAKFLNINRRKY